MPDTLLLHRFTEYGALNASELAAVLGLGEQQPQTFERGEIIRGEGEVPDGFFLQLTGWVAASISLPDGSRQILKVHLPGDALGTPSMAVTRTVESLTAITRSAVLAISFEQFGRFVEEHPRLGTNFMLSIQRERIALMDQLVSIGRTSAEARIAAFLCDLLERLEPVGLVTGTSYTLPLTQAEIGDVTGMTSVHVNRTMRDLEARRLIAREGKLITISDHQALSALAARPLRILAKNALWVPAPRN